MNEADYRKLRVKAMNYAAASLIGSFLLSLVYSSLCVAIAVGRIFCPDTILLLDSSSASPLAALVAKSQDVRTG